jgi:2-dehydro-3-deoxyphosphogalactonate aldolase
MTLSLKDALAECPVVAIIRGVRPDEILDHAEALYAAGVRGVEVPLNSPDPLASIRKLAEAWGERMVVGGGTVLTTAAVDAVAEAGGRIIVSPNTRAEVIARTLARGLDSAPGFSTPTEAFVAIEAGARHLKLFPAASFGPAHVKQIKAVLPPEAVVWAVGGVGPAQMAEWWAAGARAFGLGGELYRPGQSPAQTAENARRVVDAARALV